MAEHIKYSKGVKKTFVEGYFNKKVDSTPKQVSASEAFVYDVANDQREFFKPIFANETKYLPNLKGSELNLNYSETSDVKSTPSNFKSQSISTESLTIPPNKKKDNLLLKGLVLVAGIYVVYQIIQD